MEHPNESRDTRSAYNDRESGAANNPGPIVLPVIEEQVSITTKEIETGTVRVTRHVFEHEEPVHVLVTHDECQVERVTAGYIVPSAPEVRWEGDTMIIPVLKEVAVVEKKLLLVEELRITRTSVQTQSTEQVRLRTESIEISRTTANDPDNPQKL